MLKLKCTVNSRIYLRLTKIAPTYDTLKLLHSNLSIL